jgi:hypothetical protein
MSVGTAEEWKLARVMHQSAVEIILAKKPGRCHILLQRRPG